MQIKWYAWVQSYLLAVQRLELRFPDSQCGCAPEHQVTGSLLTDIPKRANWVWDDFFCLQVFGGLSIFSNYRNTENKLALIIKNTQTMNLQIASNLKYLLISYLLRYYKNIFDWYGDVFLLIISVVRFFFMTFFNTCF